MATHTPPQGPGVGRAVGYRATSCSGRTGAAADRMGWRSCLGRGEPGRGHRRGVNRRGAAVSPGSGLSVAAAVVVAVVGGAHVVAHPWRVAAAASRRHPPPPPADAVELRVLDDGVFVGSSAAPTTIDIFNEPICPPCGSFIRSNAGDIDTAVNNKKLAVRYHLLNFLDDKSHSKDYSTRAVAATYCVAAQNDPKLYTGFYSGLFASNFQPAENAPEDRTDGELAQLAKTVGADASVINCIKAGEDVATAKAKAEAGDATLSGLNATGTPFVWDGNKGVNYQDPSWLTKLIG